MSMSKQENKTKPGRRKWLIKWLWIVVPLILTVSGLYLLLLVMSPINSPPPKPSKESWNEPVPTAPNLHEQRVYIPRLSLNLLYAEGQASLNDGLWHRYPERGNPENGGNFILAGHRFELGLTPGETKRKSPLYHMDKMLVGDYIYADFNGKRYQYKVTTRYKVEPTQIEIEAPSNTAKMTLYSCTFKGQADGREVVEATLVAKSVDPKNDLALSSQNH
jgi:sortase A